eukprot:EG_transcript_8839
MLTQHGSSAATAGAFFLLLIMLIIWRIPTGNPLTDPSGNLDFLAYPLSPSDAYTYVPQPLSPESLAALYPSHLRVAFLQVVHRHGERTPVENDLPDLPQNQRGWSLCWTPEGQEEFFLQAHEGTSFRPGRLRPDGQPADRLPGLCDFGQLTDKGKRSLHRLGAYLRWLYVERLRALPPHWTASGEVFIRATDVVRTHDSVLSLLLGLYPPSQRSRSLPVPRVYSLPSPAEYLYPSDACPRQRELWLASRAADPTLASRVAQLRSAFPAVARWMDDYPLPADPWEASPVTAVADAFTSLVAHGLALPPGVPASAVPPLKEVADQELYRPYVVSVNLTRLVAGRLVADLVGRIDAALAGAAAPRLAVYSAHDVTVAPLLAALGAFDGRNPPFASLVSVEVLTETANPAAAHLRVQYNGLPVPLPFCPPSAAPPYTCPWPRARLHLAALQLTPAQFKAACEPSAP